MKRRVSLAVLGLCLSVLLGAYGAHAEGERIHLSLEEAIARGLESSVAMQQAELNVKLLELAYKQAEVNSRATVTPLQLAEAKQSYENAVYAASLQRVETALIVESTYYAVLKAENTLALRTNALDRALQQVDIAQKRHAMGQITDVQLQEAEQRLMEAEFAYTRARNDLQLVRLEFSRLLGLADDAWALSDDVVFQPETIELDVALATARERRYEVLRAEQAVEEAEQAVRLADNTYTPRIELERAQINLLQAQLNLEHVLDQLSLQVMQAAKRLEEAASRTHIAQSRLDLASANLSLAELRYQNGLNTLLDVLEAEAQLAEAEVEAVAAVYDYNVAKAEYLSSIGLGFERWPDLLTQRVEGAQ